MTFVTTSWDDGHPLDFKLADLLARYGVPGTFYVPRRCEGRPVLRGDEVRRLAQGFEIGAHTLSHRRLPGLSATIAASEIADSRRYVEDLTGRPCAVFAPPGGSFRREHLAMALRAGFRGFRTTELLNCGPPRRLSSSLALIPTTLQVYRHPAASYCRNALKHGRPGNLVAVLRHAAGGDLSRTFTSLLDGALARGARGVLHLWGHSWEIEEQRAWPLFESMLARIAERRRHLTLGPNSALCFPEREVKCG
jgi:peptidoglycan/xylan/chitin deacetylase (PgdA/CDA1 family)